MKIRRIPGIHNEFSIFNPTENYQVWYESVLLSDSGKNYKDPMGELSPVHCGIIIKTT